MMLRYKKKYLLSIFYFTFAICGGVFYINICHAASVIAICSVCIHVLICSPILQGPGAGRVF